MRKLLSFSLLLIFTCVPSRAQRFVKVLDNIAALTAANPIDVHTNIYVAGYRTANDGGEGNFLFVSSETAAADNGIYFTGTHPQAVVGKWVRQLKAGEPITPQMYGAKADGATVDTVPVQSMVNWLCAHGGQGIFPSSHPKTGPCVYVLGEILITNTFPVTLSSSMYGYDKNVTAGQSACITPAASQSYIFHIKTPSGNRNDGAGVTLEGLAFRDISAANGVPGTKVLTAAVYMEDAVKSQVRNCSFENIDGSAIKTGFAIMSGIYNSSFRFCGRTGHGALDLAGEDNVHPTQSFVFANSIVEACYGGPYVLGGLYLENFKMTGVGFEAETGAADSNWPFIQTADGAHGMSIELCHFNRNLTNQVKLTTNSFGINVHNSSFYGSVNTNAGMWFGGNDSSLSGSFFNSGKTLFDIAMMGLRNRVVNNSLENSGGIFVGGSGSQIIGNNLINGFITSTAAYSIDIQAADTVANANYISGVNGGPGGIRIANVTSPTLTGNIVKNCWGFGFRIESSDCTVADNAAYNNNAGNLSVVAPLSPGISEHNLFYLQPYLETAVTVDPPSIGPGESAVLSVTVTGIQLGDYAEASFDTPLDSMSVNATVIGNDRVQVAIANLGNVPLDLSSGTLFVRGRKTWRPSSTGSVTATNGFGPGGFYVTGGLLRNPNIVNGADITPSLTTTNLSFVLATIGVANGTYGSATKTVQFTVDTKGRLSFAAEFNPTNYVGLVLGNPNSAVTTGSTNYFVVPEAGTLKTVTAHLLVASSSGSVTMDFKKNGTTVLSAPVSIASGSTNATASVSVSGLTAHDRLVGEVTAAGTSAYGSYLTFGFTTP